ncbi:alpha/beta hydrolase family protein [Herbidospora mongoliensis]|uniref:alpha/beta hydrolase family protein n=1 Tax=Herbidospora mongoliensis TaxID=688067 RepID=UPI00082FE897|nr:alpha/beta fold hydrolase [Herbidospora mongoliensis]
MRDVDMAAVADDGLPLAGTLTLPPGPGPHPAVLLLHGSGRLDRDGNTRRLRMALGAPMAAALAERGIATLRYDRRGVGATGGDWRKTEFADNRRDAVAALRALAALSGIRAGAIGVVGHSEGAIHAMALAARPGVRAVVLLGGFARSGEDALRWQFENLARDLPAFARLLTPLLRALAVRTGPAAIRGLLAHDSRADLPNIKAAVLAITGGKDVQVDPADLDEIRRLVPGEVETHRIADLTHLLRRDPGPASARSYPRQLRQPIDPGLLAQVTTWLAQIFEREAHEH